MLSSVYTWFGGSATKKKVTLTIVPNDAARRFAGFHRGISLTLTGSYGETVGTLVGRLNEFRGPDQQIIELWSNDGTPIVFSTIIPENGMSVVLRG